MHWQNSKQLIPVKVRTKKKKKKIRKSERISSDLQQKPSKIYPLNEILLEQSHWWSDMKE